ncbi:protein-L-isoaspartate O-methyltransferase family protein [Brevibacterium linens]|uniref:Protein-L-isoaspartate O-methyltransferase n=1 Tax=Brevibacterium linens ATCC 9172 TaxID=1255617 RepID=A0A2H1HTZ8_BRELN|nr:protein-L-isoaspartate O-methyltransferase [Brevibacterium linens]KAB1949867.1 protein-L-isoaspartate O-methyltransferase [Brevibacterium linens ATCC 9172]SMX66389.1 protein-L-isoaspartate(D-aspartate) O-methyltransferase [Brevibacterium linens ATCC 9172]
MTSDATHDRIAEAFARVPREPFLPVTERQNASGNVPLPIGHGQTNSQPSTVADMLRLLDPQPGETVLDLGSGSGWTSMLLAVLVGPAGRVLGVERHPELVETSRAAIDAVTADSADREALAEVAIHAAVPGALGLPAEAPFDRILVSAGAESLPAELVDQLALGATMVIPVAGEMLRVVRDGPGADELAITRHGWYRFVPLISE